MINFLRFFHKNFLHLLNYLLLKTSGSLYCFLFNINFYLQKISTRAKYKSGFYNFFDNNFSIFVINKRYGFFAYCNGLTKRALWLHEDYCVDQINFQSNDVIIDCGANVGDFYLKFKFLNINIKYYAFEPGFQEMKCLKKNIKNQKLSSVALFNQNKIMNFYYKPSNADNSLIKMKNFSTEYSVEAKRLDFVIKDNVKIKLFKVEAEGAEPEVLQGAINVLKNIEYICVDCSPERGEEQKDTLHEVQTILLKNNFSIIKFNKNSYRILAKNLVNLS